MKNRYRKLAALCCSLGLVLALAGCDDSDPVNQAFWIIEFRDAIVADSYPHMVGLYFKVLTHLGTEAPDGTRVDFETTGGSFDGGGTSTTESTLGGEVHVGMTMPRGMSEITVSASIENDEASLRIILNDGSVVSFEP